MKSDEQNGFLDDVRGARPALRPPAGDWMRSRRGRRVLARVIAGAQVERSASRMKDAGRQPPHERLWARRGFQVAVAAVAVVIVALTLSLTLALGDRGDGQPAVVDTPQTTTPGPTATSGPGVTEPARGVATPDAVQHVIELAHNVTAWFTEASTQPKPADRATLLAEAVEQGLVEESEISGPAGLEPMSQGRYAVLMWQTFGHYFPATTTPTTAAPDITDPAEREAVQGLRSAGVIREADGVFLVDQPLTGEQEALLFKRLEDALKGKTSG